MLSRSSKLHILLSFGLRARANSKVYITQCAYFLVNINLQPLARTEKPQSNSTETHTVIDGNDREEKQELCTSLA
uniref:Putative ovule protein n=1 Tax=Solanum chacoense TaxID=4108 RepID=A0A0V0HFY5_SOLCH